MSRLSSIPGPARLTSSLLARKGEARPAGAPARPAPSPLNAEPAAPLPSEPGRGKEQGGQANVLPLAGQGAPERAAAPLARRSAAAAGGGSGERFATTIRLDAVRHYRLKLFAARRQLEVPDLITRALDAYLDANAGDCPCVRGGSGACSC